MSKGKRAQPATSGPPAILPVIRTKAEAQQFYDRISRFYDYLAGPFERRYRQMALDRLAVTEGESVLEIGCGTGHCLEQIARRVGQHGKAYGADISMGMLAVTRGRLRATGLTSRVALCCGDAASLPYEVRTFDAVFMSFTLELFDTPEIPKVLAEIRRVLKPEGRVGVASMSREDGGSLLVRLYEWAHRKWPNYVDCRPIYVEQSLRDAGLQIRSYEARKT